MAGLSIAAIGAETEYDCHGDGFATYGIVTLTVDGKSLSVDGSFTAQDYGPQERSLNECKLTYSKEQKKRTYFEAEKDLKTCGDVHYATTEKTGSPGILRLSLVNRDLADSHDYSGYAYASFGCTKKKTK